MPHVYQVPIYLEYGKNDVKRKYNASSQVPIYLEMEKTTWNGSHNHLLLIYVIFLYRQSSPEKLGLATAAESKGTRCSPRDSEPSSSVPSSIQESRPQTEYPNAEASGDRSPA